MAISGVSTNGLNFTGLATGIDTAKIVSGLTALSQQRIDRYKSQQADIATKQTAFAALQGKLFDLQSKTASLAKTAGGAFDGRVATASDTTVATAVAGTAAVAGTYALTVTSLAKGAQVASTGFADPNTALKTGTLKITVGSGATTTVTVDSRNNTLQGLADSINAAGGDARASVVSDSATGTYKLLLTSSKTGATNQIVTDASGLTGGTGAAFDPAATTVQLATDAKVTVGSGGNALTVSSPTNQVNGLINGVTLNVLQENKTVSVTVKPDTDATVKAVQDFVTAFNGVKDQIADLTKFDPATNASGVLLGDRDVAALANDLSSALSTTIPGLGTGANRLSSVGLAFDDKGKLTFDSAKLSAALSDGSGTTQADFKKLFSLSGTSDTAGVDFFIGSSATLASGATPYQVNVTAPATRAVVLSSGPPAAVVVVPANAALQIKINSLTALGVSLPAGSYNTTGELIAAIQKAINSAQSSPENYVTAALDPSGSISLTTNKYGSAASIAVTGATVNGVADATLLSNLGFSGTESASGTNVTGNFVANGQTEAAFGTGQILAGASGNTNTSGLQVKATGTTAATANVTVTQGLASRLNTVLNKYIDPVSGRFKIINEGLNDQSTAIGNTIDKQNALLEAKTADLQSKFAAMESAVNSLKGLQTQLSSLTASSTSNK
ncbi:flagellar filament capping protein FliD [Gemmata sp. JC673]|uniref:Flagellar hook-associated protein 2 n=1 Tax=Gemmata algarum TaxID=2975278 RepID=A0ABU5ETU3_9BACT|nr:flagellar filament capping protein FliD [Gemmata algarum]MDY3557880.1 flagellar filament capping protein FliD [Gemmata algarum]